MSPLTSDRDRAEELARKAEKRGKRIEALIVVALAIILIVGILYWLVQ